MEYYGPKFACPGCGTIKMRVNGKFCRECRGKKWHAKVSAMEAARTNEENKNKYTKSCTKDGEWEEIFLAATREKRNDSRACAKARVSYVRFKNRLKSDPEFRAAYEHARSSLIDKLEAKVLGIARKGHDEPVYYKGDVVGTINKVVPAISIFMLKKLRPKTYSDEPQQIDETSPEDRARAAIAAFKEMDNVTGEEE